MEPVTRKELFLAKAAGQKVQTPTPVTREEYFIDQISANMPCGDMPSGSDTLYWDGNTEGLLSVEIPGPGLGTYVKVSDVALTWDEAYGADGKFYPVAILYDDTGVELGGPQNSDELQACTDDIVRQCVGGVVELGPVYHYPVTCYADWVIAVLEDNVEIGPFAFPEKGIYFKADGDARAFKLQGYTGFPSVKKIDCKYLPEALQFGDMPTGGDTLHWDGNTEGLLKFVSQTEVAYYKVSDVVLTEEELYCYDGVTSPICVVAHGSGEIFWGANDNDEVDALFSELGAVGAFGDFVICALTDNYEVPGLETTFPEKGIYFAADYDIRSFYLYNCTRFPSYKQLDPKSLPPYGVFLDLGEKTSDAGAIPNWNDDLKNAIVTAFERGEPVRCLLDIGSKIIVQAVQLYPNSALMCTMFDHWESKHRTVELNFANGAWHYYEN